MSLPRAVLSFALFPLALAAQRTWVVDPSGAGNFTDLGFAQAAAAPGDTLVLRGLLAGIQLTKALNLVAQSGAFLYTPLTVSTPGPLSVSGGRFELLQFQGTTASLDGVSGAVRLMNGATISARACTLAFTGSLFGGAEVGPGSRAVFDGCSFQGRDAVGMFGSAAGTAALQVGGHAELRGCTMTGGQHFTVGPIFLFGGAAIDLAGSVDLKNCVLSSGLGRPFIDGAGTVRAENTVTVGAMSSPSSVTITAAQLPWTTGTSAAPGGILHAQIDGPAATLAVLFAGLGMRPPTPLAVGDVWTDPSATLVIAIGVTDPAGALTTTVGLPLQVQSGLQITFQGLVALGAIVATAPAILQVL